MAQASSLMTAFAEEPSAYTKALAAYQDRRLDKAFQYAKEAAREEPARVDAHFLLGELHYLRQELSKARESWERALRLDPSREDIRQRLDRLKREAKVESGLSHSDTAPFVVRFAEGQVPVDLGILRQSLREATRLVGQSFQYFPSHPIAVILYPQGDFEQVKGLSHKVAGLYDGKIRLPVQGGSMTGEELKRILWHEYTHALIHDLAKGRCPLWLNEGIATLQEARVRSVDLTLVRPALRAGRLLSWDQLWQQPTVEGSLEVHYQQAYLIARYLVQRWGWSKMVRLLKSLGQGVSIQEGLKAEYRQDPVLLEREWARWAKRL
jgi:hypothetical protein